MLDEAEGLNWMASGLVARCGLLQRTRSMVSEMHCGRWASALWVPITSRGCFRPAVARPAARALKLLEHRVEGTDLP